MVLYPHQSRYGKQMRDHVFHECADADCNVHERQHLMEGRLEQRRNETVAMKAIEAARELQEKQNLFTRRERPSTTTAKAAPSNIALKLELTMKTADTPKSGYI